MRVKKAWGQRLKLSLSLVMPLSLRQFRQTADLPTPGPEDADAAEAAKWWGEVGKG